MDSEKPTFYKPREIQIQSNKNSDNNRVSHYPSFCSFILSNLQMSFYKYIYIVCLVVHKRNSVSINVMSGEWKK